MTVWRKGRRPFAIGIEILSPRRKGVRLDGLPLRDDVAWVVHSVAFRIVEGAR